MEQVEASVGEDHLLSLTAEVAPNGHQLVQRLHLSRIGWHHLALTTVTRVLPF
jgi:hypothetical protein